MDTLDFTDMSLPKRGIFVQIFGIKTCDTCRKSLKLLPQAEFIDVRTQGIPQQTLQIAYETFGSSLLNTRSTTWRGLNEVERGKNPMLLLAEYPTLMKRPLILEGENLYLGWKKDVQNALGVA